MRPISRVVLTLFAAVAGLSRRAAPQDTTRCSFDTAAHTLLQSVTLSMVPPLPRGDTVAGHDYLYAAQAIQSYFQRPGQVRLPFWARTVGPEARPVRAPSIPARGLVRFRLDAVGRLADQDIAVDYPSDDVAESIVAAVKRADSANAFPPPSRAVLRDHGTIRIRLLEFPDSVRTKFPLIRMIVPAVVVDSSPALISFPRMRYPDQLRDAGVTGGVALRFLILPNGHVDGNSLDLLAATYREFAVEVVEQVQGAKFRPARIGACAVPMVVTMPINFKIRHNQ